MKQQMKFHFNPKYEPRSHPHTESSEKDGLCSICGQRKDEHHEEYQTHPTYSGFGCSYCGSFHDKHLIGIKLY